MKVTIGKHPSPGFKLASISVPVNVGDVPGAIVVRCAHPSAVGALAAATAMAQQIAQDPTLCQVLPEGTDEDIAAVNSVALAARAGFPTLHAASLQMSPGQQRLARALQGEARTFGGDDDPDGQAVGGLFDSIANLARDAVNSVVNYADPDNWPDWMKKLAKPLGRVALDAAATAVFGPAGPAAVETMISIVDKAQSGDQDAEKQIESIAKKALKGDAKAKVLMSAVHEAGQANDIAKTAAAMPVGDAADDYMAMYGAAYDPNTWANADQNYEDSSQASQYMDQQFAQAADQAYDNPMPEQYGPVYSPQYAAQPGYGYQPYGYAQPQLPAAPPPQISPDGQFWMNGNHWERIPAGGIPGQQQGYDPYAQQGYDPYAQQQPYGYPQQGQPAGYDSNGWPFDANGQPWPADSNGQPMDPSQQQQQPGAQPAPVAPNVRAGGSRVIKGAGARGGGVTVTSKPRAQPGQAYGSNARDNRSSSKGTPGTQVPMGFTPAQASLFGQMINGKKNPNDHRSH